MTTDKVNKNNKTIIDNKGKNITVNNKTIIDNKGNWEFSFFQKKFDPVQESNIKLSLKPSNSFNPKLVHQYINPDLPKEEQLLNKQSSGVKLNAKELIIIQNYLDKKEKAIQHDIENIKLHGVASLPTTKEGRTRKLLEALKQQLNPTKGAINNISVANIYLRFFEKDNFELMDNIRKDYKIYIDTMNKIVTSLDLIELQFTTFYSQMPPLNNKGFVKFDDWQVKVIENIDNNISTIVNTPTSAGKSVLSGYVTTKGKSLFIVPTDALAWQMSSYIGSIMNASIPIVTKTYQSHPCRDDLIKLLNNSEAIVGTCDTILDYLPLINIDFKWLVIDEIHMMGEEEGRSMEHIIKILNNIPVLGLSATIGNTDELTIWLSKVQDRNVDKIICDKRFFNLQRYYYKNDKLNIIHPLSLVDIEDIKDKSILDKTLYPTPPDIWDLSVKLKEHFDLDKLNPHKYFNSQFRIELDDANLYFKKLLEFMVNNVSNNYDKINNILKSYNHEHLEKGDVDLVRLAFKLKEEKKNPVIIFNKNTIDCLKMAMKFSDDIDKAEKEKYPKLYQDRIKMAKIARRKENNIDNSNSNNSNSTDHSNKEMKHFLGNVKLKKDAYNTSSIVNDTEDITVTAIQEPHSDFIFNDTQLMTEDIVKKWNDKLHTYFPQKGEYYHDIIILLWRGVGIYAKGLPDPYLRLVQTLAGNKQLAIVFSDESLVFGVSMPFRTVVILDTFQDTNLYRDIMLYHQMSGRAGRRGLDKEGNVIFAGFDWNKIKSLSISKMPNIVGNEIMFNSLLHSQELTNCSNNGLDWKKLYYNHFNNNLEDAHESYIDIESNYKNSWKYSFDNHNKDHLYLNWKLRYYSDSNLIISYLIPFLKKGFEQKICTNENNQIEIAHFLSRFLLTKETNNPQFKLENPEILKNNPFNQIINNLNSLQIIYPRIIDNRVFVSIQNNLLVNDDNIRNRLIEFGDMIKELQHYFYHQKNVGLTKLLGKLLTRIWWIIHNSSF
jgi:hypothetical protein